MKLHFFSIWPFLLIVPILTLSGGLGLVEARTSVAKSGNGDRGKARRLTATTSKSKISAGEEDDSTTASTSSDDELSSSSTTVKKGSIASRTSSVVTTHEDSSYSPEAMGILFVEPKTAAPVVTPPTKGSSATKAIPSVSSNSTSTSSSTPMTNKNANSTATSPSPAAAEPSKTIYPSAANPESIASRTSTMDDSGKVPLSASMEFDTPPGALSPTANSTKSNSTGSFTNVTSASSGDNKTTADVGDEDISANFDIYCDDSLSVPIAKNTTSSKTPLVFPREKDQPKEWPEIVGGLFIVAAIGFFWMTAFKNYRKRKDYQQLPITMNL